MNLDYKYDCDKCKRQYAIFHVACPRCFNDMNEELSKITEVDKDYVKCSCLRKILKKNLEKHLKTKTHENKLEEILNLNEACYYY